MNLRSEDPSVADLVQEQPATVSTNVEGYALWRVHIKTPGVAQFTATASDFEPVTVDVVGMPAPARTFREAELLVAQARASQRDDEARLAAARMNELEKETNDWQKRAEAPTAQAAAAKNRSEGERQLRASELRAELEKRQFSVEKARASAREAANDAAAAHADAERLAAQLPTLQPPSIAEADLKPGDILLVLGSTPIVSALVRRFEEQQLGGRASYSHASLYLGRIDGQPMVAEMWSSGYWITPLSVSTKGALVVDVYRWEGINEAKRKELADRAAHLFGEPSRFTSALGPQSGSPLPYAFEEIALLTAAANWAPELILRRVVTGIVDPLAGGRRKMICSELVAWVYRDVGLDLEVTYWKRLTDANLLTTDERRKDYTTPNMIARSKNLNEVGRYLGP